MDDNVKEVNGTLVTNTNVGTLRDIMTQDLHWKGHAPK
jgi:hypothetical protein